MHGKTIRDHWFKRVSLDLTTGEMDEQRIQCEDLEDLLGGIGRGFKLLQSRPVSDAYSPDAVLVMNLGVLSGSSLMTGLRSYFQAFSPLKRSHTGLPSAMWSAGSGKFGTKLRFLGIDEVVFHGRCSEPSLLHIARDASGTLRFNLEGAAHLLGKTTNEKIQELHPRFPDAHFAVIGPAGERYQEVRYAAIALSTENQLKSGDAKSRFCGRGGMGGILGSKKLLAIVADAPDAKLEPPTATLKALNKQISSGDGSRRFREPKTGGVGGTWANAEALGQAHALPEYNFAPTGSEVSAPLYRPQVEGLDRYEIKAESCFRCGIRCHKNLYETHAGKKGRGGFKAKIDYEPLNLLSSNIGIFDLDSICELIELTDLLGLDSISCGVTLAYAMEYNRGVEASRQIADGLTYGDFEGARRAIEAIGRGQLPLLGQGVLRLSEELGEPSFAMHCKGVEFPAYLPQTNPGYPWALAGGHMSMRTYLLLLNERETSVEYWAGAITDPSRGPSIIRDDIVGTCKFAGLDNASMASAVNAATGLEIDASSLEAVTLRTFLRGIRLERLQGMDESDYRMPARVHDEHPAIDLPHFNSPEFFESLRAQVSGRLDELLEGAELEAI